MADFTSSGRTNKEKVLWYHHIVDFANIFKAFIGTNYLSLAYALKMSGLGVGLGLGFVICIITTHCCQLIIRCKLHLVDDICYQEMYRRQRKHRDQHSDTSKLRRKLMDDMDYADIGRLAVGKWGGVIVNLCIGITQTCFCVQYCIFVGTIMNEILLANQVDKLLTGELMNQTIIAPLNQTTVGPVLEPVVPFQLLVFLPIILFVPLTLFRNVRQMGAISIVANLSVLIGFFSVMIYILQDFHVNPTFEWANLVTIPVFIGSLTAAYEAIGVIIPIQSSMEDNRHNFGSCLNVVVLLFTFLIFCLGVVGYLQFGEDIQQIIAQNLPADQPIVLVINITLVIGVLLTYPLQIFPVVEILEGLLFGAGQPLGPPLPSGAGNSKEDIIYLSEDRRASEIASDKASEKSDRLSEGRWSERMSDDEAQSLLGTRSASSGGGSSLDLSQYGLTVGATVSREVATWKRNIFRSVLALIVCLLAVALRNVFAYVGAFAGALGSSPLSFILPCLFHIKIQRQHLGKLHIAKNIAIMVFGVVCTVLGVTVTLREMIRLL